MSKLKDFLGDKFTQIPKKIIGYDTIDIPLGSECIICKTKLDENKP